MKTLIDLRPGDFIYSVNENTSEIEKHEVTVIKKNKIETYDRHCDFTELDHTAFAIKTEYSRMSSYALIMYTNKLKALKQSYKIQRQIVDLSYKASLKAIEHHSKMYDKLIDINAQVYLEEKE